MIMKMRIIKAVVLFFCLLAVSGFAEYDPNRTEQHTILMSASPYVTKTLSGNSSLALPGTPVEIEDFVIGTTPGSVSDSVPPHNIYAYKISDPCTAGPKTNIVIMAGNHPGETSGSWALQGMVDFCASDDANAVYLRQIANVYVYPLGNPDGRYIGSGRGNPEVEARIDAGTLPEHTINDHNRLWQLEGYGLSTIDALVGAMKADTGGEAEYFLDFHSGSKNGASFYYTVPSLYDCLFAIEFAALDPHDGGGYLVGPSVDLRPGDFRMTRVWAMRPEELNARYGFTPENSGSGTTTQRLELGRLYGLGVYNALIVIAEDPNADYLKLKDVSDDWLINNLEPVQLIAHWNFDDDDANDSSGNEHHGTIMGSVTIVEDANIIGAGNKVAYFPGDTSSFINCGGGGGGGTWADFAGDKMTIAAWFRTDGAFYTSYQYVCAKENMWRISRYSTSENIRFFNTGLAGGSTGDLIGTIKADDGEWHHVAGVYNGTNRYLYFDGELDNSDSRTGNLAETTWDIYIGGNGSNPGRTWRGWIDDVRLYNCSLSEDEITALARRFSAPVAWWKLDESGVSTAADSTGNGHTGTLHNNPTWQPSGGQLDGALSFDEVDDYVTVTDFDYTNESNEFSLGFWFKLADVSGSGYQYVFSHGLEQEYNNLDIYFRESEQSNPGTLTTRIRLNAGDKWQVSTPAALADGQWHMYTITVSSVDGATVYIDDESVLTNSAIKGASFNPGTALYLGARQDLNPNRHYGSPAADDGLLDDVRIYDYVLTLGEIEQMYQDAKGIIPPELVCSEHPAGDLNDDCVVNSLDFAVLGSTWLKSSEEELAEEYFSDNVSTYEYIDSTWSHNIDGGDNRVLVVTIAVEDNNELVTMDVNSITYNGVSMNPITGSNIVVSSGGTELKTQMFYLLEADLPEPGHYTVAITYEGSVLQRLGGSFSRANVAQQAPEAVATNSNTGQDTISTDITTVTANAWVVDVVAGDDQGSFSTTTGGMTERWDVSGNDAGSTAAGATKSPASAGLTTMSWSYSSGANMLAHSIAAFETLD